MASKKQQDASDAQDQQANKPSQNQGNNALEWVVALLGGLIVVGTLGYLTYKVFGEAGDPPALQISLEDQKEHGDQVLIPVTVENVGGRVATDAIVEVCAGPNACAQLTFNYVPHASKRKGMVGFSKPLSGSLTTRVVSYREP